MGSNLPITERLLRSLLVVLGLVLVLVSPGRAARTLHIRGIVLGTTATGLDVGTPDRIDIHLEISRAPPVFVAERSSVDAIREMVFVTVVAARAVPFARAAAVFIVPSGLPAFDEGRFAWDLPGARVATVGRVTRCIRKPGSVDISVVSRGRRFQLSVPRGTPVLSLRKGSRGDLISPRSIMVFASPPTDGISDVVETIVVGDGEVSVPL